MSRIVLSLAMFCMVFEMGTAWAASSPARKRSQSARTADAGSRDDSESEGARDSAPINALFGYTHLLPSPFTVPAGRLLLGTDVAYGLTDFFQMGTNLLRDFYKVWNANAKVSLINYPEFAAGITLGFQSYNLKDIDSRNPDARITTWQPGMVTAFDVMPNLAWFLGGNVNLTQADLRTSGIQTSGYVTGANLGSDLSWAYNPSRGGQVGNVLSGGVSYDVTYKVFGFGLSHHWKGFHLGLHYFPNADRYKVQPILSGGTAIDL